ncbi:MAG: PRC-barrel domain-containing protein, partial [Firmicutes bacterium]|nr:PRC-barrel domain-containing protein [Bacillota bacterium]
MAIAEEIFMSRLLGKTVVDPRGKRIGRLSDVLVNEEELPRVVGLAMRAVDGRTVLVDWQEVHVWIRQYISLRHPREELALLPMDGPYLYLRRDLLDKQIVDLNGRKVVRINDLKLAAVQGELRLIAVDIGFRGLLRRLGLRRFVHWWERRVRDLPDTLIRWQDVERIETGANRVKLSVPYQRLAKLHPADLADIIEDLNNRDRTAVLQALETDVAAEAFQEIEPEVQSAILEHMNGERASDLLETMPADEAAEILGELPDEKAEELLSLMEAEQANEVRELLEYEEGTAGRLMTREFLAFGQNLTVDETIARLREAKPDPDVAYYLYVIDDRGVLRGVVSLRDLVISPPATRLGE